MKTCHTCQQTYSDDVEFCPRDGALHSAVAPTFRSAHAGLKPGATSVAALYERRPAIGDRRYNRRTEDLPL